MAADGPVNWPGYKCQCPWISPSGTPPCLQGACPGYPGWGREERQPSDMGPVSCAGVQITVGRDLSPLGRHPACRERARFNRGGESRRSASPAYGQALPRGPRPVALTIPGSRCGSVRRTLSLWVFCTLGDEVRLNVDASAPSLGGLPEVTLPGARAAYPDFVDMLWATGLHLFGGIGFRGSACSELCDCVDADTAVVLPGRHRQD